MEKLKDGNVDLCRLFAVISKQLKKIKGQKLGKILRKSQPNF